MTRTEKIFTMLEPYADGVTQTLPHEFTGKRHLIAVRGMMQITVYEEQDGSVEMDLMKLQLRAPTGDEAKIFFNWLGVHPLSRTRGSTVLACDMVRAE